MFMMEAPPDLVSALRFLVSPAMSFLDKKRQGVLLGLFLKDTLITIGFTLMS